MKQDKQPEALRLATELKAWYAPPMNVLEGAAEELHRLHAESEQHQKELRSYRITVENREARIAELEAQLAAAQQDAQDTIRLNWLDAQVKNHAVHNGFLWQEGGWENDRGLVCAIQGKKQKKTVRQAIDAAIAAQAKQGGE